MNGAHRVRRRTDAGPPWIGRIGRNRWRAAAVAGAAGVGWIAGACGGDAPGEDWAGRVDTLAGGGVRVASPAGGLWTPETAWRLEEDLRIGSLEGGGPDMLGAVGDVSVDGEGRIHVLEQQAHEIRVFGPDGSHLRTFGREGDGPGELNVPFGGEVLFGPQGRIWVNNAMNRRWELFSADGELLGSSPQRTSSFGASTVVGRDGAFYQRDQVRPEGGGDGRPVVMRREVRGDSLVTTDTLDAPGLPDGEVVDVSMSSGSGGSLSMRLPVPFVHQPGWSFDPTGHFWVEPGDGYRLVALSPEHDTLRIVERAYDPVRVTEAEIEEALEMFTTGPLAGSGTEAPRSRVPDHHPAFDRYRTDASGHLWVRRTLDADRRAWDVFDPDGRYLGEVSADVDLSALTVHAITDDAVYGVLRGELDEPYVVRLAIVRGG